MEWMWYGCGKDVDVVLLVDGQPIKACRELLVVHSEYFAAMFRTDMVEMNQTEIEIRGVTANDMKAVVKFTVNGTIDVDESNVRTLLAAASMFLVNPLIAACTSFLTNHLDATNCVDTYTMADRFALVELRAVASVLVRRHFVDVVKTKPFLMIDVNQLAEIISQDELNVTSETEVFEALLVWLDHDRSHRQEHLSRLLSLVRLPLVPPDYLVNTVRPACNDDQQCCRLVDDAIGQLPPVPQPRQRWETLFAATVTSCYFKQGFNLSPLGRWSRAAEFPLKRHSYSLVNLVPLRGKFYVLAGDRRYVLFVYCPRDNVWSEGPVIDRPKDYSRICVHEDSLYLCSRDHQNTTVVLQRFELWKPVHNCLIVLGKKMLH